MFKSSKIKSIKLIGKQMVYDLSVENDHSFIANGIVVHNCVAPNIQNIPRGHTAGDIKKFFIAPKGYVILQLDYAQAELRVMAEMANETSMIEAFATDKDIHTATACKKYGADYDMVSKILKDATHKDNATWTKRRKQAKTINFGIIYCQGPKALAESLSEPAKDGKPAIVVTKEQAAQFLKDFDRDFPRVNKFIAKQQRLAREQGFVRTMFGRKRRLPDLYSPIDGLRMEAERQAVNAPVQGTASDFALLSSVLIEQYKDPKWKCHQIYTVHDSIGFYILPQYVHEAVTLFSKIVQNPQTKRWFGFEMKKVKMLADFEVGLTWRDLSKYSPSEDYTKLIK